MTLQLKTNSQLDPDVQSYIYQAIHEFEPFLTPSSTVEVREKVDSSKKSKSQKTIEIILQDNGGRLEATATGHDIYAAISGAKLKLLEVLGQIQDNVTSSDERGNQIRAILNAQYLH
jgi:ribosomal subunit interface protein